MNWFEAVKNTPETNYQEEGNQSCCNQAKMNIRKEVPQLYDVMWKNGYFDQRGSCQILKRWFTNKLDWNGKPVVDSGKRLRLEQKKKGWLQDWKDCEVMRYGKEEPMYPIRRYRIDPKADRENIGMDDFIDDPTFE